MVTWLPHTKGLRTDRVHACQIVYINQCNIFGFPCTGKLNHTEIRIRECKLAQDKSPQNLSKLAECGCRGMWNYANLYNSMNVVRAGALG